MSIGDALTTHTYAVELGKFQVETVQDVSALTCGQDVIEVKQVTSTGQLITHKQPGPGRTGEVTITRGMDKSKAFTDWVKTTLEGSSLDAARQNVTIVVMDGQKNPVRRIQLRNAWASQWTGPSLDAGTGAPATEEVTITYEDVSVE